MITPVHLVTLDHLRVRPQKWNARRYYALFGCGMYVVWDRQGLVDVQFAYTVEEFCKLKDSDVCTVCALAAKISPSEFATTPLEYETEVIRAHLAGRDWNCY